MKKPSEERIENGRETEEKQEEALNQADSDSGRKTDVDKQIKTGKRPSLVMEIKPSFGRNASTSLKGVCVETSIPGSLQTMVFLP